MIMNPGSYPDELAAPLPAEDMGATTTVLSPGEELHELRRQRRERIIRAAISAATARAVNMGVQVLALALTVRYLGSERYGMWVSIGAIIAWMGLANFGLGNGLTTRLSISLGHNDRAAAAAAISNTVAVVCVAALVILTVGAAASTAIPWAAVFNVESEQAISEAHPTVLVAIALFALILPAGLGGNVLLGHQRGDLANAATVCTAALGLGALYLATRLRCPLPILAATLMLPQLASGVAQWGISWRLGIANVSWKWVTRARTINMLTLGCRFFLLQIVGIVVIESSVLIIAQKFGSSDVTPYGVTQRMVLLINAMVGVVMAPLWPAYGEAMARGDIEWARRVFWRVFRIVLVLSLALLLLLGLLGKTIILLWAGREAVPGTLLLWSMLGFNAAYCIGTVPVFLLNGMGRLKSQLVGGGLMAILHVPLALWLCAQIGVAGVAVSQMLLMMFVSFPPTMVHAMRVLGSAAPTATTRGLRE